MPEPFQDEANSAPSPRRVLVVDDDQPVRRVVGEMLRALDCDVTEAASGEAAIATFARQAFDVIFLDVGMPGMSGVEVCHHIRQHKPRQQVVFITGYAEQDLTQLLDQYTSIIPKPFTIRALASALTD